MHVADGAHPPRGSISFQVVNTNAVLDERWNC
jgi:hypothetical protein